MEAMLRQLEQNLPQSVCGQRQAGEFLYNWMAIYRKTGPLFSDLVQYKNLFLFFFFFFFGGGGGVEITPNLRDTSPLTRTAFS